MVKNEQINSFLDLKNKKIGVAGESLDKSWLFLRAYAIKKYEKDPLTFLKPLFCTAFDKWAFKKLTIRRRL